MAEIIWPDGEEWVNHTSKVAWKFSCSLVNTCSFCIQFHNTIHFVPPPIPYHPNCSCMLVEIFPGQDSGILMGLTEVLRGLFSIQQNAILGRSVMTLIRKGLIGWGDVVAGGHIRTLEEIVAVKRLTEKQLESAGIDRATIQRAIAGARRVTDGASSGTRARLEGAVARARDTASPLRDALATGVVGGVAIGRFAARSGDAAPPIPSPRTGLPSGGPLASESAAAISRHLAAWPSAPDSWLITIIEEMDREARRRRGVQP